MNEEILEALKDNIPIEEHRSEGTSDGLTHYEEDKDSWQYKLYNYITNLQKSQETLIKNDNEIITNLQEENKRLKFQLQQKDNIIKEVREKINHYELIIGDYDACYDGVYDTYSNYDLKEDMLKILDKENKQ